MQSPAGGEDEGEGMAQTSKTARGFFGWRVVAAVFLLAMLGWGFGFYGPPVFLHAVRESRGWPVPLVSAAVTTHFLFGALAVLNLHRLYRRWGAARVTKGGCLALAIGVLGWAEAREPWQLFLATTLSGAGWATMGAAAVNAILAPWFVRTRAAALSSAYNGSSVGGILFAPLWVWSIDRFGFPAAALVIGLILVLVTWVLADAYFARTPEGMGLQADGFETEPPGAETRAVAAPAAPLPGAALWTDARFLTLAAGMALGLFAQMGVVTHMFSLLVPAIGTHLAGYAGAASALAAVVGRTLFAMLVARGIDRRVLSSASYGLQMVGLSAFLLAQGHSVPWLLAGVLLFGLGIGNAISLPPLIAQAEFAKDDVARAVPAVVGLSQATYAFSPAAFGLVRELSERAAGTTPDATPHVFLFAIGLQALAILVFLAGRLMRRRD